MNIETFMAKGMILNVVLSVAIIVLVSVILFENIRIWLRLLKTKEPVGMNDGREKPVCPDVPPHGPDDKPLA